MGIIDSYYREEKEEARRLNTDINFMPQMGAIVIQANASVLQSGHLMKQGRYDINRTNTLIRMILNARNKRL